MKQRDTSLDIIRFLGVLLIMVAHSNPPEWLYELRNFATPLLVVASALTSATIFRFKEIDVKEFYKKRLSKLIFPVWIFLALYYAIALCFYLALGQSNPYNAKIIVLSYLFMGGIGYVWIFKVYIILALITPVALKIAKGSKSLSRFLFPVLLVYLVYEAVVYLSDIYMSGYSFVPKLLTPVAFTLLFLYGLKMDQLSTKQLLSISAAALVIFLSYVAYNFYFLGKFLGTQLYKNPPTLYYMSYSLFWINVVYIVCKKWLHHWIPSIYSQWLSANSLWVYLWHILAIFIWEKVFEVPGDLPFVSLAKFSYILGFGVILTFFQNVLVSSLLSGQPGTFFKKLAPLLSAGNDVSGIKAVKKVDLSSRA